MLSSYWKPLSPCNELSFLATGVCWAREEKQICQICNKVVFMTLRLPHFDLNLKINQIHFSLPNWNHPFNQRSNIGNVFSRGIKFFFVINIPNSRLKGQWSKLIVENNNKYIFSLDCYYSYISCQEIPLLYCRHMVTITIFFSVMARTFLELDLS